MATEILEFEEADCQSDDGRFVQLRGDGAGEGQHFGQLVELVVLFASPRPRRIPRLLFANFQNAAEKEKRNGQKYCAQL
jgi:hypothetical protein